MLTSAGRLAARRVPLSRAIAVRPAAPAASASAVASPFHLTVRALSVSRWAAAPPPAQGNSAKTRTTTKSASSKKAKATKAAAKQRKKTKQTSAASRTKNMDPEQKATVERRVLKRVALLNKPTGLPSTAYQVYLAQKFAKGTSQAFAEQVRTITASFKTLSSAELEVCRCPSFVEHALSLDLPHLLTAAALPFQRLQAAAHENAQANKRQLDAWLKSHPPEVIYLANLARGRLNRRFNTSHRKLHDDRLPKRALSSYSIFVQERASANTSGSAADTLRAVAGEWKRLSDAEKQVYKDRARRDASGDAAKPSDAKKTAKQYWVAQGVKDVQVL